MKSYTKGKGKHGKFVHHPGLHNIGVVSDIPDKTAFCESRPGAKQKLRQANRSLKKAARRAGKKEIEDGIEGM